MRDKRLGRARGTAQAAPTPQPRTPSQRPPIPPPPVAKFFGRQDVFRPSPLKPSGPFDLECFLDPDTRRLVGLAQGGLLLGSPTDVAVTVPLTEGFITGMTMYVVGDSVRAATVRVRRPDGSAVITQCGAVPLAAINPVQLIPGVPGTNYLTSLSGETRGGGGVGEGEWAREGVPGLPPAAPVPTRAIPNSGGGKGWSGPRRRPSPWEPTRVSTQQCPLAPYTGVEEYVASGGNQGNGSRRALLTAATLPRLLFDDVSVTVARFNTTAPPLVGQLVLLPTNSYAGCTNPRSRGASLRVLCLINFSNRAVRVADVGEIAPTDWGGCRPDGVNGQDLVKGTQLKPDESACFSLIVNTAAYGTPFRMFFEPVVGEPGPPFPKSSVRIDMDDAKTVSYRHYQALGEGIDVQLLTGGAVNYYMNFYLRDAKPDLSTAGEQFLAGNPGALLQDLVVPASHDAGMVANGIGYHESGCSGFTPIQPEYAYMQRESTLNQLRSGARYLDVRPVGWAAGKEVAYTWHGDGGVVGTCFGDPVRLILEDVHQFLVENPKETVFIVLSHCEGQAEAWAWGEGGTGSCVLAVGPGLGKTGPPYFYRRGHQTLVRPDH